jgi:hypothetical protein
MPDASTHPKPFQFLAVAHLTRIGNDVVETLQDLHRGLDGCSDASIFFHLVQASDHRRHAPEGCPNDLARWVLNSAHAPELAEQIGAIDLRDYDGIAELRADLRRMVGDYCATHATSAQQPAADRFYFCERVEVTTPSGPGVTTLDEWYAGVEAMSRASFAAHFVSSRLRVGLRRDDFSIWLGHELGLTRLAERVHEIDVSTQPIDHVRAELLRLVAAEGVAR